MFCTSKCHVLIPTIRLNNETRAAFPKSIVIVSQSWSWLHWFQWVYDAFGIRSPGWFIMWVSQSPNVLRYMLRNDSEVSLISNWHHVTPLRSKKKRENSLLSRLLLKYCSIGVAFCPPGVRSSYVANSVCWIWLLMISLDLGSFGSSKLILDLLS